jgi:hypothetical protein
MSVRGNKPNLLDLPMELLIAILSLVPLQGIGSVRSTSRKGRTLLGETSQVWRSQAISMHEDWIWELKDGDVFSQDTTARSQVLWLIRHARSDILAGAGSKPFDRRGNRLKSSRYCWNNVYRPMLLDSAGRRKLPLGLQNRLRIWCCLGRFGKDRTEITLQDSSENLVHRA